jgi:hypothetical protein
MAAIFVVIRGLIVNNYGWGFWLAALYFCIGAVGFFFLLLSVDNHLRYQKHSGLSLDDNGNLKFKRMKQFAKFLQISDEQLAKDFSMINSKLKTKATAKELMDDIAEVIVRDGVPYEKIIKDFRRKDPESLSSTKNQLSLTAITYKL